MLNVVLQGWIIIIRDNHFPFDNMILLLGALKCNGNSIIAFYLFTFSGWKVITSVILIAISNLVAKCYDALHVSLGHHVPKVAIRNILGSLGCNNESKRQIMVCTWP
jgi:hypothetical protein